MKNQNQKTNDIIISDIEKFIKDNNVKHIYLDVDGVLIHSCQAICDMLNEDKGTNFTGNQVLSWNNTGKIMGFEDIFKFAKKIEKLCEDNELSRGFVYSLMHIWQYKNNIGELPEYTSDSWTKYNLSKSRYNGFMPRFVYKLRLIKKPLKEDLQLEGKKFMPWIKIPVSWSSLRLR